MMMPISVDIVAVASVSVSVMSHNRQDAKESAEVPSLWNTVCLAVLALMPIRRLFIGGFDVSCSRNEI